MPDESVTWMDAWAETRANERLEPLPSLDLADMHGKPRPERRWIVPNIIPERECTLLSGDGGEGKTQLEIQLAVACVLGRDWIGRPARRCRVAAMFCEDDEEEIQIRLADVLDLYDATFADIAEDLLICCRKGQDNLLMEWSDWGARGTVTPLYQRFERQITEHGAELVIVDSLHNVFAGDEMRRPHAQQFVDLFGRLAGQITGACVLSMHPSVAGRKGTGEAGSTGFRNTCRSMLYLKPHAQDPRNRLKRELRLMKANRALAGGRIQLEWTDGVFVPLVRPTQADDLDAQ